MVADEEDLKAMPILLNWTSLPSIWFSISLACKFAHKFFAREILETPTFNWSSSAS